MRLYLRRDCGGGCVHHGCYRLCCSRSVARFIYGARLHGVITLWQGYHIAVRLPFTGAKPVLPRFRALARRGSDLPQCQCCRFCPRTYRAERYHWGLWGFTVNSHRNGLCCRPVARIINTIKSTDPALRRRVRPACTRRHLLAIVRIVNALNPAGRTIGVRKVLRLKLHCNIGVYPPCCIGWRKQRAQLV
ncbi:hypothetical protein SDC9_115898 [bioreactor metagenome]|uniref:Uncharacterized protein n=1 Tax=bioreactor metagenome TaxID=1076179 RepID=A0A645BWF2_9ZZZZ